MNPAYIPVLVELGEDILALIKEMVSSGISHEEIMQALDLAHKAAVTRLQSLAPALAVTDAAIDASLAAAPTGPTVDSTAPVEEKKEEPKP